MFQLLNYQSKPSFLGIVDVNIKWTAQEWLKAGNAQQNFWSNNSPEIGPTQATLPEPVTEADVQSRFIVAPLF